jgi:curved DNA-binding protein CbpA
VSVSERRVTEILSAKLELKKQPQIPVVEPIVVEPPKPQKARVEVLLPNTEASEPVQDVKLSLEKYLGRIEHARTHYETLGIPIKSKTSEVKMAYFSLAKQFHPDLYYKTADAESHRRIQHAFTEIAHAYEVLRNEETRTRYDFRLKSILDELDRQGETFEPEPTTYKKLTEASDVFDHGFNLLMEEDFKAALPYISRAAEMAPEVARFHAYLGKALSIDSSQKFKAESEFQAAIKLEPENPMYRIMLAEFFVQYNLLKRAEGELNRLLASFPDNMEAKAMLDSLR